MSSWTAASSDCSRPVNNYVHVKTADLYRPNARLTPERQGYQVLTPFGKLGHSPIHDPGGRERPVRRRPDEPACRQSRRTSGDPRNDHLNRTYTPGDRCAARARPDHLRRPLGCQPGGVSPGPAAVPQRHRRQRRAGDGRQRRRGARAVGWRGLRNPRYRADRLAGAHHRLRRQRGGRPDGASGHARGTEALPGRDPGGGRGGAGNPGRASAVHHGPHVRQSGARAGAST